MLRHKCVNEAVRSSTSSYRNGVQASDPMNDPGYPPKFGLLVSCLLSLRSGAANGGDGAKLFITPDYRRETVAVGWVRMLKSMRRAFPIRATLITVVAAALG